MEATWKYQNIQQETILKNHANDLKNEEDTKKVKREKKSIPKIIWEDEG